MNKKIAFLTIHGMGDTKRDYYKELKEDISKRVGPDAWSEIHFDHIYYADVFQNSQTKFFNRVKSSLDSKMLRKFLLYGFSDAGGLEHSRSIDNGPYFQVQKRIFDALGIAFAAMGQKGRPVVLVAQSLGGQVISNYIWDAQHHGKRPPGIWSKPHGNLTPANLRFRKFSSLQAFLTTGCNIPIFIAGIPEDQIVPINPPNQKFIWENYYDQDDALGWPMQKLNASYKALLTDKEINAGNIFKSWNPFSHGEYWGDKDFQVPLADHLLGLLGRQ